ncbi:unnamed protein product, partial [Scytosiphon promiscuus]
MASDGGNFKTLRELTECMRASMLLPGITGPMVRLPLRCAVRANAQRAAGPAS